MITGKQHNTAQIRRLLNQTFDDPSLDAFCQDYFPAVYDRFSRGMRKDEKITLLIDHCRRTTNDFRLLQKAIQTQNDNSDIPSDKLEEPSFELDRILNLRNDQTNVEKKASQKPTSAIELGFVADLLRRSYDISDLKEFAKSLNLPDSALPTSKRAMAREIVLFAYKQGRYEELILRLGIDGKLYL